MPKGIKGFQKGHPQFNTGRTHFKKGCIPWHKGKKLPQFSGKNSWNWKGGRIIASRGYIWIKQPTHPNAHYGYVPEHRFVIEQQIGHYLLTQEASHHINKIKSDNRPENLMAFVNHSAHRRFEMGGTFLPKEIIFDGRNKKGVKSV